MKKFMSFFLILFLGVLCSACVNTLAVQELNQLAAQYLEKGDVKNAISRLESSVDLDGNIFESRYNLAVAYLKENECEKALKNIEAAQKLSSDKPEVYYTLGVANNCQAEQFCKTRDSNIQTLIFDPVDGKQCEEYLKKANSAFEKYLELSVDADDAEDVKNLIQNNNYTIGLPKS